MSVRARLASLNRLQHSRWFKIIASAVVVVLAAAAFTTYLVGRATQDSRATAPASPALEETPPDLSQLSPEERAEYEAAKAEREAVEATAESVRALLGARGDPTAAGVAIAICAGLALAVVWIGQGLTTLAILLVLGAICYPLAAFGSGFWSGLGQFIGAVGLLTLAFVVLMELLRAMLSPSHPVSAIARNVVNEAVRMKVSLVFIVLLLLGLAVLPALLDETTPLRYRVQNFLSWGTGGTFWLIALLTVFLAVGTVAFEQRDRVIWQTMTKPVASWQYLIGKWLGVVGVSAVLLGVSTAGVFLFTEYLRAQPAQGESAPFIAREGLISQDRLVLESQVMAARRSAEVHMPELDPQALREELQRRAGLAVQTDPNWQPTPEAVAKLETDLRNELRTQYLTIEGAGRQRYEFRGLGGIKRANKPITFRFKASVGADDPRETLRVSFLFPNAAPIVREVPLGQMMAIPVAAVSIDDEGVLRLEVINGDIYRGLANPKTMSFPPDGISIAYPAGSYRANFARVVVVLWLKLAFLAMVGVASATFLSFAVASLVSFGVFLIAEGTGFLSDSLEYYPTLGEGKLNPIVWLVRLVAGPINRMFKFYGDLTPTQDLVDGKLLEWSTLGWSAVIICTVVAVLYGLGVWIFRSRELATYSGQ